MPHHAGSPVGASRARGIAARLVMIGAALLLAGCGILPLDGAPTPSPSGTLLPEGTTSVRMTVGQTVQVSLGEGSPSAGGAWVVASQTAGAVVTAREVHGAEVHGGADATVPGGTEPYALQIEAKEPGTTTLRVLHCPRTVHPAECAQGSDAQQTPDGSAEITVTVS